MGRPHAPRSWRVDVNLGGRKTLRAGYEHLEPNGEDKAAAKTSHRPFNGGKEGFEDWDPLKFTMLSIQNDKKRNARNQPFSYDLVPIKHGNGRHYGPDKEECTWHDFWVSRNRKGEIYYRKCGIRPKRRIDHENGCRRLGQHPCPPRPRSEDGEMKGDSFIGVTQ